MQNRQLTWADIPADYYIRRFNLELSGRSYAANYLEDPITEVYRRIYLAYCKGREDEYFFRPDGTEVVETGVFESDIKAAEEEIEKRRNGFYDHPTGPTAPTAPMAPFSFATVMPK
jgi:hypothetical protein